MGVNPESSRRTLGGMHTMKTLQQRRQDTCKHTRIETKQLPQGVLSKCVDCGRTTYQPGETCLPINAQ